MYWKNYCYVNVSAIFTLSQQPSALLNRFQSRLWIWIVILFKIWTHHFAPLSQVHVSQCFSSVTNTALLWCQLWNYYFDTQLYSQNTVSNYFTALIYVICRACQQIQTFTCWSCMVSDFFTQNIGLERLCSVYCTFSVSRKRCLHKHM